MTFPRILLPLILLFGGPTTSAAEQLTMGSAQVVDGDTLELSGTRVDLFGIDAPETGQICAKGGTDWYCGIEAQKFLAELIGGSQVVCQSRQLASQGALISSCTRDGLDLGLTMIEAGLAVTTPDSPAAYVEAEALRKTHKIGLWSANFQAPAEWRKENPPENITPAPLVARAQPQAERVYRNKFGCAIKGNRNRKDQWIYHLPGKPHYDATRPEELFCTESDARRAGYRRSKA